MKKSRQRKPSIKGPYWDSRKYEADAKYRMEVFDALGPQEKELVNEYGYNAAMLAIRQFYGRWAAARECLEEQRRALQVNRWENIS